MAKIPLRVFIGRIIMVALIGAFFLALRNLPLLATLGYESANFFVVCFGPILCFTALLNCRSTFRAIFLEQACWALIYLVIFSILLIYNGLSHTSCSPGAGWPTFLVMLIPPIVLNIALGSAVAAFVPKVALRIVIFLLAYPAYLASILFCWWQEANFRILTHALILINQDLLGGAELSLPLVAFRAATMLYAITLIAFAWWTTSPKKQLFRPANKQPLAKSVLVAVLLLSAGLIHWQSAKSMGKDHADLDRDYSLHLEQHGLIIRANPQQISHEQAQAILDEALYYQNQLSQKLSLTKKPIIIWLHKTEQEKYSYTGAKNVHFALPKHREIHLDGSQTPHPVLGHELAHIVVGEYATTWLGLPGIWGLIPNMALTEGLAMYLTPALSLNNDLSMLEQARALHQAGLSIDVARLFTTNPSQFALSHSRSAYIFSGAFLEFALAKQDHKLPDLIKAGSLSALFSSREQQNLAISEFNALLTEPVAAYAILWAQQNFSATSIIGDNCNTYYQEEKTAFNRNLLNLNPDSAIAAINHLPDAARLELSLAALDNPALQDHCGLMLRLSKISEDILSTTTDPRINQVLLKNLACLSLEQSLVPAQATVLKIDPNFLNQSQKRQQIIIKSLLFEQKNGQLDNLAQQIITTIFRQKNISTNYSKLAFSINHSYKNFSYYFALYLLARLYLHEHDFSAASDYLIEIINNRQIIPEILLHEAEIMLAHSYYELKNYQSAQDEFLALVSTSYRPADIICFKDYLSRIRFIRQQNNR